MQPTSFLFDRWTRYAVDHPWPVIIGAFVTLVILAVLYVSYGGRFADSFSLPGTESQRLRDLLEDRFPEQAGDSAIVVVRVPAGLDGPEVPSRVETLVTELGALPEVVSVESPYGGLGTISEDGTIARISVQYGKRTSKLSNASLDALLDFREQNSTRDFQVEAGGRVALAAEGEGLGRSELIGLTAAVVILLIAFGSVFAMGLPIVTALFALTSGFFMVGIAASVVDLPSFTPQFAGMIGIGVGIDYALLIVTRFREGLGRNLSVEDAVIQAAVTAGRSVVFAGTIVVIALLGLWFVGIPFISHMASAAALVVALSVIAAVVVLPAVLKLVGHRIDSWHIPWLSASAQDSETGGGYRLSRLIQRAPIVFFVLSLAVLAGLALPMLSIRLGTADAGNNPESRTSRRAYDLLSEAFGPGFNGPVLIGVGIDDEEAAAHVEGLSALIEQEVSVGGITPAIFNDARTAAVISVIPETSPQSEETEELVDELRRIVPRAMEGTGAQVLVGGSTAGFIDIGDRIAARLPYFIAAVIGLSFVLLTAVFRSILVPLKAAVMNVLSIGAAYGVLVAIFQWGWLGSILGDQGKGPIESFLPMMLFAVLFGLSMDYEIFLVGRIQEEYLKTGDNSEAVARGLSVTTRVISAAAAIMVAVFLGFALSNQRVVKEFGIGLGTAVFLDATLVRLVLVPSIMLLLGDANWWFPRWLDRLTPKIGLIEAPSFGEESPAEAGDSMETEPVPIDAGDPRGRKE